MASGVDSSNNPLIWRETLLKEMKNMENHNFKKRNVLCVFYIVILAMTPGSNLLFLGTDSCNNILETEREKLKVD